jgi:hypothetical protein
LLITVRLKSRQILPLHIVTFLKRVYKTKPCNVITISHGLNVVIGGYFPKQLEDVIQIGLILLPRRKNTIIRNTIAYAVTTEDPIMP